MYLKFTISSAELEAFNTEVLVPLEQMIGLIESRLNDLEVQVTKLQTENGNGHTNTNRSNDATDEENDDYDVDALSDNDGSVSRSPTDVSSPSPTVYPNPKFAPKRFNRGNNSRRNPF